MKWVELKEVIILGIIMVTYPLTKLVMEIKVNLVIIYLIMIKMSH